MNTKLKEVLQWVGVIGSIITAIAYLIVISVLVFGMSTKMQTNQVLLVSIVGAFAGLMITVLLRGQGISFAASEDASKEIMRKYYNTINKNKPIKKLRTIKWFAAWQLVKDIFMKVITLAASTYFMITIFMEGNGDTNLIWLGFVNILMFVSFGILAMSKAYTFYIDEHLAAIQEITNKLNEQALIPVERVEDETE